MDAAIAFARQRGAWCLVAETQAANYPAARFYQRVGMRLCAIDDHFYDPSGVGGDDVAIFFALDLDLDPHRRPPPSARGFRVLQTETHHQNVAAAPSGTPSITNPRSRRADGTRPAW